MAAAQAAARAAATAGAGAGAGAGGGAAPSPSPPGGALSEYLRSASGLGSDPGAYGALRRSLSEAASLDAKLGVKALLGVLPKLALFPAPDPSCLAPLVAVIEAHSDRTILRLAVLLLERALRHAASAPREKGQRRAAVVAATRLAQQACTPCKPTSLQHVKRVYCTRALAGVPADVLEEATGERAHTLPLRVLESVQKQGAEASQHKRDKQRQHLVGLASLERAALQLGVASTALHARPGGPPGAQRLQVNAALSMAASGLRSADAGAARHSALMLLNAACADAAAVAAASAAGSQLLAALQAIVTAPPAQPPPAEGGRRPSAAGQGGPFAAVAGDTIARAFLARAAACVLQSPGLDVASPAADACRVLLERFAAEASPAVCLEAICGLAGARGLSMEPPQHKAAAGDGAVRGRAWCALLSDGARARRVLERVTKGLSMHNRPTMHAACRAASALLEARVWAARKAYDCPGHAQAEAAAAALANAVRAAIVCESVDVRAAAMEALVWAADDHHGATAALTTADLLTLLEREVCGGEWRTEQVGLVLYSIAARVRASPSHGPTLLHAVARCAKAMPSAVAPEAAGEVWQAGLSTRSTQHACKAAVVLSLDEVLAAPPPSPSLAAPGSPAARSAAVHTGAWLRLQRAAASFLGENANYAVGEYAWQDRPLRAAGEDAAAADAPSGEEGCRAANPLLSVAIERLECLLSEGVWEVRAAAVRALAKIAVRSGEPFRVAVYRALRGVAMPATVARGAGGRGLSAVAGPTIRLLDAMYLAQEELMARIDRARAECGAGAGESVELGREDRRWVKETHAQLMTRIPSVAFVPDSVYLPLGRCSAEALGRSSASAPFAEATTPSTTELALDMTQTAPRPATQDWMVIVQPFKGEEEGEMTVAVGERYIRVPNDAEGWVLLESFDGALGLVPEWAVEAANVDSPPPVRARVETVASTFTAPAPAVLCDADPPAASSAAPVAAGAAAVEKLAVPPLDLFGAAPTNVGDDSATQQDPAPALVPAAQLAPIVRMPSSASAVSNGADDEEMSVDGEPVGGRLLYDFEAAAEGELSVRAGEEIKVLYEMDGWFMCVHVHDFPHANEKGGLVPESYVEIEEEDEDEA